MLATLPPVYGLYCSMFASFFYFLLGTSRHLSLGTVSVISLLVGGCLDRNIPLLFPNTLSNESTLASSDTSVSDEGEIANRVLLASALAMTIGIIQLIMSLLRLGFLARLLSDPMFSGLIIGASVHVGISQVFVVFGLNLKKHFGIFNAPRIILGGVLSCCLKLKENYNVKVVGTVPTGLPYPEVPRFSLGVGILGDAFVIALIIFSVAYSLASFYGNKEGYKVDPNQELLAYGVTNAAGSFFTAFPMGAAISRTVLLNSMKVKSQIVSLIAAVFVLIVILFAGPLFYHVPNCCLSAIILVALRGVFLQLLELPVLWRYSVWDFASWIVAFLAAVMLDVIYGLIIGVAFSALVVFFRSQFSKAFTVAHVEDTEVFRSNKVYDIDVKDPKIKIIRYEGGLFYAGADLFVSSMIEASGFDPRPVAFARKKLDAVVKEADVVLNAKGSGGDFDEIELASQSGAGVTNDNVILESGGGRRQKCCPSKLNERNISRSEATMKKESALNQLSDLLSTVPLTHIILDCSAWTFIDMVGAKTLQELLVNLKSAGVTVYLASLSSELIYRIGVLSFGEAHKSLLRSGLFEKFSHSIVFISVFDAYIAAQEQQKQQNEQPGEV
ncbi:hypothetical protein Aperf_G00000036516 [Anoplocephala perfoliata]